MGRISINDTGKFATNGNNDFFFLADDGDVAKGRLLYDQPDGSDMDYYVVHEVEIGGKKRYVACNAISESGDSLSPDKCPLCAAGYKRIEKLFLQIYIEDEDKVQTWDRGRNFVQKIQTYINRYGSLVNYPIEIERKGKSGDSNTTYEMFVMENDGCTLEDFPEKQELLGTFILEVSEDDMDKIIAGTYKIETEEDAKTERRNTSSNTKPRTSSSRQSTAAATTPTRGAGSRQATQAAPVNNVPAQAAATASTPPTGTVRRGRR